MLMCFLSIKRLPVYKDCKDRWEDKGLHTFLKGISLKVNVIGRPEFELTSYNVIFCSWKPSLSNSAIVLYVSVVVSVEINHNDDCPFNSLSREWHWHQAYFNVWKGLGDMHNTKEDCKCWTGVNPKLKRGKTPTSPQKKPSRKHRKKKNSWKERNIIARR